MVFYRRVLCCYFLIPSLFLAPIPLSCFQPQMAPMPISSPVPPQFNQFAQPQIQVPQPRPQLPVQKGFAEGPVFDQSVSVPDLPETEAESAEKALPVDEEIDLPSYLDEAVFGVKGPFISVSKNQKLTDFIDAIAAKKNINIVFTETINTTINFPQVRKLPLPIAERYMHTFLQMSGFAMHERDGFYVVNRQTEATATRDPLPLYVHVPPSELPQSEERIRAIYYLSNFRVPEGAGRGEPIDQLLRESMSGVPGEGRGYLFDPKSNAVILIGPARRVASVMSLILRLDQTGTPERLETIQLFNSSSAVVAKLFTEQIIATAQAQRGSRPSSIRTYEDLYFAPNTRVVADTRTNSLIVLGREATIARIRDLIRNYIDVPLESGKSVIHVYDLQYLKAAEFAEVLKRVVTQESEQSKKELESGPQRWFDNVLVWYEQEEPAKVAGAPESQQSKATIGGNRLVIAASSTDWERIKTLIEQLDKPEPQVILEVMIVDFDVTGNKALGSQIRNPASLGLPDGITFQSAQLRPIVLDPTVTSGATTQPSEPGVYPSYLASDLLALILKNPSNMAFPNQSMAWGLTQPLPTGLGSMIISLKDPQRDNIWAVLQVLEGLVERKVVAHPFLVTKNNTPAVIKSVTIIANNGAIASSQSAVTTINIDDFKAVLSIDITPRISSIDRVNLTINVTIEDFVNTTTLQRTTRAVGTNSSLGTGQILVVGGLTRSIETESEYDVPFFSQIPIIGYLFKSRSRTQEQTNLAIFIHPTIVDPKLRAGIDRFTGDRAQEAKNEMISNEMFGDLYDPVTHFYFGTDDNAYNRLSDFVARSDRKQYQFENGQDKHMVQRLIPDDDKSTRRLRELFKDEESPIKAKSSKEKAPDTPPQ